MALKKCGECGNAISNKADKCPQCGAPQKKKTSTFTWFVAVLFLIGIGNGIVAKTGGSTTNSASTPVKKTSTGDSMAAWAYIQQFVERDLKSPSSADFPFGGHRDVISLGGGRYKFNSYVDAENAFGAKLRTHFKGVIARVDGGWKMDSLQFTQ